MHEGSSGNQTYRVDQKSSQEGWEFQNQML